MCRVAPHWVRWRWGAASPAGFLAAPLPKGTKETPGAAGDATHPPHRQGQDKRIAGAPKGAPRLRPCLWGVWAARENVAVARPVPVSARFSFWFGGVFHVCCSLFSSCWVLWLRWACLWFCCCVPCWWPFLLRLVARGCLFRPLWDVVPVVVCSPLPVAVCVSCGGIVGGGSCHLGWPWVACWGFLWPCASGVLSVAGCSCSCLGWVLTGPFYFSKKESPPGDKSGRESFVRSSAADYKIRGNSLWYTVNLFKPGEWRNPRQNQEI